MKKFDQVAYISLFDNKGEGNKPKMTGVIDFPDKSKWRIALWEKTSPNGVAYLSGNVTKETELPDEGPAPAESRGINLGSAKTVHVDAGTTYSASGGGSDDLPF